MSGSTFLFSSITASALAGKEFAFLNFLFGDVAACDVPWRVAVQFRE